MNLATAITITFSLISLALICLGLYDLAATTIPCALAAIPCALAVAPEANWTARPAREDQPAPDYARAMKALDNELATPLYTRLRAVIEANEAAANERRILARRVSSSPYYQAAVNAVFAEAIARNSYGPRTADLCSFTKRDLANQWAEELYSAYLRHGGYNTPGFSRAAAMVAKSALYNAAPRFITKKMWPAQLDAIKSHLWADYDRLADEINALNSGCIVS